MMSTKPEPGTVSADLAQPDGVSEGGYPVSVLGKAHLLLSAFAGGPNHMGLTELSRSSGLPKATVHRLGTELASLGYLSRSGSCYQLGWRIFELGRLAPEPASLSAVARPVLLDVKEAVRAFVVHLTVPRDSTTFYLERLAGRREIGFTSVMGQSAPSLLTASGRIFLATSADRDTLLDTFDHATYQRFTQMTGRAGRDQLHEMLDLIDEQGWAIEKDECVTGMKTLAVPVRYGNEVIAGISASIRSKRQDDQSVLHTLWEASADIGRALRSRSTRHWGGPTAAVG